MFTDMATPEQKPILARFFREKQGNIAFIPQVGGEPANPNINAATDIMAIPEFIAITPQSTRPVNAGLR
jgi:hypothetical protein